MCPSLSDHVSLFIGLHFQAPSDKGCPVCRQGKHLYVPSVNKACLVYTMRAEHFCNLVFVICWFYTSIDVYLLKELVSSVWELLSP